MHFDWAYDGVNTTVPRNAGPECRNFLSPTRMIIECLIITILCIFAIRYSWSNIIKKKSLPDYNLLVTNSRGAATNDSANKLYHQQSTTTTTTTVISDNNSHNNGSSSSTSSSTSLTTSTGTSGGNNGERGTTTTTTIHHYYEKVPAGKQILLVVMTLILGLELGFKFASRSVIYILNPCHIITMIQIYILAARPSKTITILFRIQMNYLNGPFLAFMFPETDSRQFTLEKSVYWIQHALMWIIPAYLLRVGGVYTMEPITNFDWNILGYAILMIYHFCFLQILSVPTQVNLNHMLCPAILDPFEGPNYRIAAIFHQGILCPLLCKLMCFLFTPRTGENNNHHQQTHIHQLEQSSNAHSPMIPSIGTTKTTTCMTPKSNKLTANGNHKNLVNSNNMDMSDMIVNAISRDKKNCGASELFLSKDVKID